MDKISSPLGLLTLTLALLASFAILLWMLSVRLKNASIIDMFWGPFCAIPALVVFLISDGSSPRSLLVTFLVCLWASRLALYLAGRNIGHGEDFRYQAMRKKQASDREFEIWSLTNVFLLQATIAWVISLPTQLGQFGPDRPLGWLALIGGILFFVGLAFESLGDYQLAKFKKNPSNKGKLMTQGLWSWTRHPNYFGDACVWFGLSIIALEGPFGWAGILSPFIMAFFLINISGKALLEKSMVRKYPEYGEYKNRVSGFFPRPPAS